MSGSQTISAKEVRELESMELIQPTLKSSVVFLIFVADVAPMINNFISLYADDSKLFNYMYDTTDELIQEDINILSRWADDMQMSFNVDKCHTPVSYTHLTLPTT